MINPCFYWCLDSSAMTAFPMAFNSLLFMNLTVIALSSLQDGHEKISIFPITMPDVPGSQLPHENHNASNSMISPCFLKG